MRLNVTTNPDLAAASKDFALTGSRSESVQMIERTMTHIAPTNLPIVLVGECGTGKAFMAHQIHELSVGRNRPFVKANCSSLTPEVVASYFVNSAIENDRGGKGTLFLAEISELSKESQRSLLYAIPEEDSDSPEECMGPRLISSTRIDLEEEVSAGRFRRELLYRLKGAYLHLLPLRERKEDLPAFSELLLTKHAVLQGRTRPRLDAEDFAVLQQWHWPGNIRELEHVIKQIVILNDAKSVLADLVAPPKEHRTNHAPTNGTGLKVATRAASRRVEEQLILDALARTRWNRKRAAQDLQISYKSLLSKLKQIGADESGKA